MELLKNIKKNTFILLFITGLVLFFVLKDNLEDVLATLKSMDIKYILLAIFFFLLSLVLRAFVCYKTVSDKSKFTFKEAIKHNLITQFFNGITPFSTGGQPMEIYMLTEHNIKVSHATNIIIQNFIFYQTALVLYGLFAVGYNFFFQLYPNNPVLKNLVLLGFIINTLVAVFLFLISFSSKVTKKVLNKIINFSSKKGFIKKEKIVGWNNKIDEFYKSAKELRGRKSLFLLGAFCNLLSLTCLYIVPLFIVYSVSDFTSISPIEVLVSSAYVLLMGSFVPIPGASGGIEYGFLQFFGNFISLGNISAILLIWRFITYYLGMILGALAFSLEKKVED